MLKAKCYCQHADMLAITLVIMTLLVIAFLSSVSNRYYCWRERDNLFKGSLKWPAHHVLHCLRHRTTSCLPLHQPKAPLQSDDDDRMMTVTPFRSRARWGTWDHCEQSKPAPAPTSLKPAVLNIRSECHFSSMIL